MNGYLGEVRLFAGDFLPKNWAYCDGRLLRISTYPTLFGVLGNTYGGNGRTTFGLPNCCGRSVLSAGQGPGTSMYTEGGIAGHNTTTMVADNLPSHTHVGLSNPPVMLASEYLSYTNIPTKGVPGYQDTNYPYYSATANSYSLEASVELQVSVTGDGAPFSIMQPCLGMNYIICMVGTFPAQA